MDERQRAGCRARGIVPIDYPGHVAEDWPDLLAIVRTLVKPQRDKDKRDVRRERWWQFAERTPALRAALRDQAQVLATGAAAAMHHAFAVIKRPFPAFSHKVIVVAHAGDDDFAVMQSRIHEHWSAFNGSTFGSIDAPTYNPSQVLDPFPFPPSNATLRDAGTAYHDHRAALMVAGNEGLTRTYNRFHDTAETEPGITRLRALHHDMDVAVLRAYGWDDLADRAAPEFRTEDTESDHRYQGRLFWPAPFRDEVLARLLDLNARRAAEEKRLGLAPLRGTAQENDEDEAA